MVYMTQWSAGISPKDTVMAKRKKPVLVIEIATDEQLQYCSKELEALAARMASHKSKSE